MFQILKSWSFALVSKCTSSYINLNVHLYEFKNYHFVHYRYFCWLENTLKCPAFALDNLFFLSAAAATVHMGFLPLKEQSDILSVFVC